MHNIIYDDELINQNNLNGKINVAYIKTDDLENSNNNEQDGKVIINENAITKDDSKDEISTFKVLDGGWGWLVLAATIWSYGNALALFTNYSLIYPYLINYYNQTENHVVYAAWIGSISFGLACFLMSISSILIDLFNPAKISFLGNLLSFIGVLGSAFVCFSKDWMKLHFITYGFLFGIGQSFIYSSSFAILPHYFDKKLGLVMGLLNTGSCVIVIASSILVGHLLTKYGLVVTFFVSAAIFLTACLSSLTFKTQIPRENSHKSFKERFKESLSLNIFRKPKFVMWVFSTLFGTYGNMIPILTMGHYVMLNYKGFRPEILNVIYGLSSGIISIGFGKIMDHFKYSVCYNYVASYFFYGFGTILINYTKNLYFYCFLIIIFSVFDGLFLCSLVPMAIETAESNIYSTQALGYYHTIIVISIISAPAVSGALFEHYGDYFIAYNISAICSFFGAFILLFYKDLFFHKLYLYLKNKKKEIISTF